MRPKRKGHWPTLVALGFGFFVDSGEDQSMGVLYPAIKSLWGLSNFELGLVGTVRKVTAAFFSPLWGYAADRWSRKTVLVFGTGMWGIWTLLCGLMPDFGALLVVRTISGIGLGCLMPATFSLISDTFAPHRRGRALGILGGIGFLGIIGGVLSMGMLVSNEPGPFGLEQWRWGFFVLGAMSVFSGLLIWLIVREPVRGEAEPELAGAITAQVAAQYSIMPADLARLIHIPTIWVAILQGMAGTMPWVVLGQFFPTWLVEAKHMSANIDLGNPDGSAPVAFALILVGSMISNVVGGFIGDWADRVSPRYGRTAIGQFSVFCGIPLSWALLTQTEGWPLPAFLLLCFLTALMIGWPGRGAKEPMMQSAVPPELRSSAYSLNDLAERGFAALISVVAGGLAGTTVGQFTTAMLWTVPGPWILCFVFFSGFYWAYPRDAARLRAQMERRRLEMGR